MQTDRDDSYDQCSNLLNQVKRVCETLAPYGWGDLFKHHGIDILAFDLRAELSKQLHGIDRNIEGFRDFALEGCRGVEPGKPSHSLLFHALASPQVTSQVSGEPLRLFPTPGQIETIENYVYGACPPSIQDLRAQADGAPLAIVVFAYEYRPAMNTVHQRHADMCFSRVGIARVGTFKHEYLADARGYLPFVEDNPKAIRVLPCRYSAYVAAQYKGDKNGFGPMRFKDAGEITKEVDGTVRTIQVKSDHTRSFWVPLHKLFDGDHCIRGINIDLKLAAHHINQKLRKVHQVLASQGNDTGWHEPCLSQPPFKSEEDLAELSPNPGEHGLIVPCVHKALVATAMYEGKIVTYNVPKNSKTFSSSLNINARLSGARSAPEYVHARHKMNKDGTIQDLNNETDVTKLVQQGGYAAVHYIDYTADGWIKAECPSLALEIPRTLAAYSLIAPPDFFPIVKQQELMQWWNQSSPPEIERAIWPTNPGPPETLCDIRYPANLNLEDARFDLSDDTVSSVVAFRTSGQDKKTRIDQLKNLRSPSLPDGAAGVFAPGWDCSIDRTEERDPSDDGSLVLPGVTHLAGYGLGSPFPEDAKLCAALSSFWPAAAPDVTRTFEPGKYATATPLTDDVIGQGGAVPWDGILGPKISTEFPKEVEYVSLAYGDYVEAAIGNTFSIAEIGKITSLEYAARTLVMARVYSALSATTREEKTKWALYSFTPAKPKDAELQEAERQTGKKLGSSHAYRFIIYEYRGVRVHPKDFRKSLVGFDEMLTIFADPIRVFKREPDGRWKAHEF